MEPSFSEEDRRYAQLEVIFRTHFAGLYRYIYRQVHHVVIAEDLTEQRRCLYLLARKPNAWGNQRSALIIS